MPETLLTKDLVPRPDLWQLLLRLSSRAVDVLLYSPIENNSLIYRSIPLDVDASTPLKAIEEAIYNNPLLLCEFNRISVIVETKTFMAVPPEVTAEEDRSALLKAAFADFEGKVYANSLGSTNAMMVFGLDADVAGFLERTFFNVGIYNYLSPLCKYFVASGKRANTRRVYANLRADAVDLIAVDHAEVLMVNTMAYRDPMDAVYYVLASFHSLGLDPMDTELLVVRAAAASDEIVSILRNHISSVMPVIFPSVMFKAGKDAMKAPFDLIVLPLCE